MSIQPQVRIVVTPYGSALPLGFFSFGIGMLLYAALGTGWVKPEEARTVGLLLVAFVAPLELLSAVIAFLARDSVAGTSLGLFAGSWLGGGLVVYQSQPGVLSKAFGFYLLAFTVVVLLLGIVAFLGKPLIAVLLLVAAARTLSAALYELGAGMGWNRMGGWLSLVIFCVAMYGGIAFLLEDATGKTILPTFRTGASKEAVEGDLSEQLRGLDAEAGVRQTL